MIFRLRISEDRARAITRQVDHQGNSLDEFTARYFVGYALIGDVPPQALVHIGDLAPLFKIEIDGNSSLAEIEEAVHQTVSQYPNMGGLTLVVQPCWKAVYAAAFLQHLVQSREGSTAWSREVFQEWLDGRTGMTVDPDGNVVINTTDIFTQLDLLSSEATRSNVDPIVCRLRNLLSTKDEKLWFQDTDALVGSMRYQFQRVECTHKHGEIKIVHRFGVQFDSADDQQLGLILAPISFGWNAPSRRPRCPERKYTVCVWGRLHTVDLNKLHLELEKRTGAQWDRFDSLIGTYFTLLDYQGAARTAIQQIIAGL